uniref:Secreted protein n=1 Tax=Oryza meridionalis TaxID=40149 RepID=A0A0E0EEM4_9ORYZ
MSLPVISFSFAVLRCFSAVPGAASPLKMSLPVRLKNREEKLELCLEVTTCAFLPGVCEVEPFAELRGLGSSGGAKMSWPLSSFDFALDICLFILLSSSL